MSVRAEAIRVRDASPLFAALGDETRLKLVARLAKTGPASISRLSAKADVTRQAITKHLEVLAGAGLVKSRRVGRERVWELDPARLADAHRHLDAIAKQWEVTLARLERD
ncbi:MAG: winged helix-turn-helix transcriptional regulator [Labilithrix sp.]|nr:winged helix-turn-helix transcriptional regulator [Labilithrix sp.]MCW5814690.1 winged helix-turn-helix transcriptional regulator [Labilithrix sp.]